MRVSVQSRTAAWYCVDPDLIEQEGYYHTGRTCDALRSTFRYTNWMYTETWGVLSFVLVLPTVRVCEERRLLHIGNTGISNCATYLSRLKYANNHDRSSYGSFYAASSKGESPGCPNIH